MSSGDGLPWHPNDPQDARDPMECPDCGELWDENFDDCICDNERALFWKNEYMELLKEQGK